MSLHKTQSYLSKLESGRTNLSVSGLRALARVYGCSAGSLLDGTGGDDVMKKYKVAIVSTRAVKGTQLTRKEAEKLAAQVRRHTGLLVAVEEENG